MQESSNISGIANTFGLASNKWLPLVPQENKNLLWTAQTSFWYTVGL